MHSAPIVPSTDMSEGFPALTHALHHSFASVMAHLCLAHPAINKFLSHLLSQAGYRASEYNTHGFRIGAATSAAMAGVPGRVIKRLG